VPRKMTEQERDAFLADTHVGVLSIARDDARPPLAIPVWYAYEAGGNVTFFTGTGARKVALARAAGVASFSVQQEQPPYKYVTVEGRVDVLDGAPTADQLLAITRRYLPEDAAQGYVAGSLADGGAGIEFLTIRPDRWLTADFSED